MRLNPQILQQDFSDLDVRSRISSEASERNLRYATLIPEDERLSKDRIYVVGTEHLERLVETRSLSAYSFFCIGEPTEACFENGCDILWTQADITERELLDRLLERFGFYNDWETGIHEALSRNTPLRVVGNMTEPVFKNPIWMWDSLFQTIFSIVDENYYDVPDYYLDHRDASEWPIDEVNAVDDTFRTSMKKHGTYYLPPVFGYRDLCRNIFINDEYTATIAIEEIGPRLNKRDEILLDFFAQIIERGIEYSPDIGTHSTLVTKMQLEKLLAGQTVTPADLSEAIKHKGWDIADDYLCMAAIPQTVYPGHILVKLGKKVCANTQALFFTVMDGNLVLIADLSCGAKDPSTLPQTVLDTLEAEKVNADLGVSSMFHDLLDIPYYYDQAKQANAFGSRHPEEGRCHRFDDHLLEAILHKCNQGTVPDALCPSGLVAVERYDQDNDTDLADTLETYLDNCLSTKLTSDELYIHRNTLLGRLKKIKEIGGIDLEDKDTRFLLQLAFMLKRR